MKRKVKTVTKPKKTPACLTCGCDDVPIKPNLLCTRCDVLLPGNTLARIAFEAARMADSPYPEPRFDP